MSQTSSEAPDEINVYSNREPPRCANEQKPGPPSVIHVYSVAPLAHKHTLAHTHLVSHAEERVWRREARGEKQ